MPRQPSSSNNKTKCSILTKVTGKRHIGTVTFDCHETGQNCRMLVYQDGNKLSMVPAIIAEDKSPLSITMELWNKFCSNMKKVLS